MRGARPAATARLENLRRFLRREDAGLAEHVAPARELLRRHRRNHLLDDRFDVVGAGSRYSGGHLVRAHERRHHVDRMRARSPASRAASSARADVVEAVAALDFAGRRAVGQHLVETRPGRGDEIVVGGVRASRGPWTGSRRRSAAISRVCRACQPPAKLVETVAGEHGVRVGVDETGNDRGVRRVDRRSAPGARLTARSRSAGWSGEENLLAGDGDCAVCDRISSSPCRAPVRGAGPAHVIS